MNRCARCGGSDLFQPMGAQTPTWMCIRCDAPDRFQIERLDRKRAAKRPCQVCGAEAAAWGPDFARCAQHFAPRAAAP